jgi:hypothetical protein
MNFEGISLLGVRLGLSLLAALPLIEADDLSVNIPITTIQWDSLAPPPSAATYDMPV